jgi:endonuclease-3
MNINEVIHLLAQEYGVPQWHRHGEPISELIATILSQNTSDVNTGRAFSSLLASFDSWEAVAEGDVEHIARAIRCGGLSQVKAARIKLILETILAERGCLELSFLGELPLPQAKAWLRQLPGVGPKTAGCVLLFSLGKPALPVDTHLYRVARKLGLIDSTVSVEQAHELLEHMVPPDAIYQFHLNMIEHGRRVCKARNPRCHLCIFQEDCPSSEVRNGGEGKVSRVGSRGA